MKSIFLSLLVAALFCCAPAKADEYVYTGNSFNTGGCVGTCKVDVTFSVPSTLPSGKTDYSFTPTSFSFSDGAGETIKNTDFDLFADTFTVWTNGSGAITQWDFSACDAFIILESCIQTENETGSVSDSSSSYVFIMPLSDYGNTNDAGAAPSIVGAPEPSGFMLLCFGLLSLAGIVLLKGRHGRRSAIQSHP